MIGLHVGLKSYSDCLSEIISSFMMRLFENSNTYVSLLCNQLCLTESYKINKQKQL